MVGGLEVILMGLQLGKTREQIKTPVLLNAERSIYWHLLGQNDDQISHIPDTRKF